MRRPDWDTYFMLQAEIAKLRSNCITRHIGSVIVKDNRQIATGYNGTPTGIRNCFDGGCSRCTNRTKGKIKSGEDLNRCLCTHAEANAIMQCALFGNAGSTKGATLYSTFTPCIECSKMAISVGINRIVILFVDCLNTSIKGSTDFAMKKSSIHHAATYQLYLLPFRICASSALVDRIHLSILW